MPRQSQLGSARAPLDSPTLPYLSTQSFCLQSHFFFFFLVSAVLSPLWHTGFSSLPKGFLAAATVEATLCLRCVGFLFQWVPLLQSTETQTSAVAQT